MRERLKVDEATWAYVVDLRAVGIVCRGLHLTSDGAAAPKGSPLARSASSTFGQRPTICYAGRLISHRRVQTCGVGLFL